MKPAASSSHSDQKSPWAARRGGYPCEDARGATITKRGLAVWKTGETPCMLVAIKKTKTQGELPDLLVSLTGSCQPNRDPRPKGLPGCSGSTGTFASRRKFERSSRIIQGYFDFPMSSPPICHTVIPVLFGWVWLSSGLHIRQLRTPQQSPTLRRPP